MANTEQRVRDPIHGLITFKKSDPFGVDMIAWQLIQTKEFQRLRRIKQLGVSDFVFPGASHTRFSHSVGVFHNARRLMRIIEKEEGTSFKKDRAQTTLLAALLHDIGHGPFSHAFEYARLSLAKLRGSDAIEKHEKFSASIITAHDGNIRPILNQLDSKMAENIAAMLVSDDPTDIYHAVVSSSFDADRLDYLMRDRYMTGTEAGHIDYDWLINNLTKHDVQVAQDDDEPLVFPTFVFKAKARHAAEDFLLARYRLYTQVYLHKTTRGFEQIVGALIRRIGEDGVTARSLGLEAEHPLFKFLSPEGGNLGDYLALDDTVIWGAAETMSRCCDDRAKDLSIRLRDRHRPFVLDVAAKYGDNPEKLQNSLRRLGEYTKSRLGQDVFRDEPPVNLYSPVSGETPRAHKEVRVLTDDGGSMEISAFPDTVISKVLTEKRKLTRYYFLAAEEREAAEKQMKGR